jgi:hypothetical protein
VHFPEHTSRCEKGSVLLEVVLALALFVGAATVISAGINASIRAVERVRLQNHAVNLAVTVLSEMQMHIRPVAPFGPEPFPPPFQEWTCKVEIAQTDAAPEAAGSLQPVEVIIKHTRENVVQRFTQLFSTIDISSTETNTPAETLLTRAQ